MYHTSGISTLGSRALALASCDSVDPVVHTFSSFLFSRNEKALQKKVQTLAQRVQQKDAIIASLRALLAQHASSSADLAPCDAAQSLEEREQQRQRRSLSDITNSSVGLLSDDESIPSEEAINAGAIAIPFDDAEEEPSEEADCPSPSASVASSEADDSGEDVPCGSPMGSQVEGQLCSALALTHHQPLPFTPSVSSPTTVTAPAVGEEVQETVDAPQVEGEADATSSPLPTSAPNSTSPSTPPASPASLKRLRVAEEADDESVSLLTAWKRVRESTSQEGSADVATPLPPSSLFLAALLPFKSRLQPFGSLQSSNGGPLTPYRVLSTRSATSAQRSIAQVLTSPMRFAQPRA